MEQYLCGGTPSVVSALVGDIVRSAMPMGVEENLILVIGPIDPSGSLYSIVTGKASGKTESGETP